MSGPDASLDAVELLRVRLPLRRAVVAAHGVEHEREVVLVRVLGIDGSDGWGECPALRAPTYTHEYSAGAFAVLRDHLAPALLAGRSAPRTHPMAASALAGAQVDRFLRVADRSLVAALGGGRATVPWTAVVGGGADLDAVLGAVAEAASMGAAMVKLKVAPGLDRATVEAVRAAFPSLALAADANGSYADDPDAASALDELGLTYLEQPLAADDLRGSARVAAASMTPIALDESIGSPGEAETALAVQAGSVLNIKPARLGGLERAGACTAVAIEWNARCFVGGMLETGVGRAASLAVASSEAYELPCDLGPSAWYWDDDLTEPVVLADDGSVVVPCGSGIGVTPRAERLATCTIERTLVRR